MPKALQPERTPQIDGLAEDMQLGEEGPGIVTAESEQAVHEGPADSSAMPLQLQGGTLAPDPAQPNQARQETAEDANRTAAQKALTCLPVIIVVADCTEEGSPRDPLAVIQVPQQHIDGVPACISALSRPALREEHLATEKPCIPENARTAEQASIPAAQAMPVVGEICTEHVVVTQPAQQPGAADAAQLLSTNTVQQTASSSPLKNVTDHSMLHASSARYVLETVAAPGHACTTGDAGSPKRERRPSSKAAEMPALAPRSPGSPAPHAPALRKRPARSKRAWKEGTYIGNGMWLMCYCSRHMRALEEMGASRAVVSMTTGQALQDALSPQPKARQAPSGVQAVPTQESPRPANINGCPDGILSPLCPLDGVPPLSFTLCVQCYRT